MIKEFSVHTGDAHRPPSDALSTNGQLGSVSSTLSVLLVDDNPHVAQSLSVALRLAGHTLRRAEGPEEALSQLAERHFDAILLDMNYGAGCTNGDEGLALLSRIIADDPAACIVVITAHSGVRIAVEAMRAGARDFVMKPWRNAILIAKLEAAATRIISPTLPRRPLPNVEPVGLIGESESIGRVRQLIRRLGPTMAGVVVTGISGSGRGLVATALHAASAQTGKQLIRIDLRDPQAWQAIDDSCGTLILRYPDRLNAVEQARLLDQLPNSTRCIAIADNAQTIGAALGSRLAMVEIAVPPLSERGEDVLLLARHFARLAAERHGRPMVTFTSAAEAAILRREWPDEVRGLAMMIERAVLLSDGDRIDSISLLPPLSSRQRLNDPGSSRFDLEENERTVIEAALREHHHNVTHAATALGLSRGALYRRMERYDL